MNQYVKYKGKCYLQESDTKDHNGMVLLADLQDTSLGTPADPAQIKPCTKEEIDGIEHFAKKKRKKEYHITRYHKGKGVATIAREIRQHFKQCGVHDLIFIHLDPEMEGLPGLSAPQCRAIEAAQQREFKLWYQSCIEPLLDELEQKGK